MADASHLEKMGRELKCPICLSLLKSAASITCNHVFCNLCIVKSMKKESSCPVCKMPFHRREIRPAPHMDNLVGIYKSMETASGVNMFMSESAPSSQIPEKLVESCNLVQNDPQRYSNNHVRTSFPSQKRVQVAHYPLPETPVHSAKIGNKNSECMPGEHETNQLTAEANPDQSDRPGTCLSPFFWLKDDEDAEDLSQQSEGSFETEVTPPAALSFSDMKDSDYESPCKGNTQGESQGKFPAVDLSDNDMLEWTQMPCSPKCQFQSKSSQEKQPEVTSQVRNTLESRPSANEDHMIHCQGSSLATVQQLDAAVDKKPKIRCPSKRKINARNSRESSKKTAVRPFTLDGDRPLNEQDSVLKPHSNFPNSEENATKRRKKSTKLKINAQLAHESIPSAPTENSGNPSDKDADEGLPKLLEKGNTCKLKDTSDRLLRSRKQKSEPSKIVKLKDVSDKKRNVEVSASSLDDSFTLRMQKRTSTDEPFEEEEKRNLLELSMACKTKSCLGLRRQYLKPTKSASPNNFVVNETKGSGHSNLEVILEDSNLSGQQHSLSTGVPPRGLLEVKGSPAVPTISRVEDQLLSRETTKKYPSQNKSSKVKDVNRLKHSADGLSCTASITLDVPSSYVKTGKNIPQSSGEVTKISAVLENSLSSARTIPFSKCESNLSEIRCAFCQSAEDAKPYGKMIHYLDGRPVSTYNNENSSMIHCHQICAEWAPNVYFKDHTAMNLKSELSRSRRISCGCCAVKGAALGCYDKSCHRSFHVPCAKLMPECRWDSENYVMLCPVHASSKLPCEMPGSQKKRKKESENKSMPEGVMTADIQKPGWMGDSDRAFEKIVLCCSALADVDKDVVAQFKLLTGAKESNKWSSSVTHVIASVDENEACRRTLKVLMGILEGKWILSLKWIKACMGAKTLVDEQKYEIAVDVHGIKGGPKLGRIRVLNKEPKLFHGLEFYLCGDFAASYKGYLQDLITAGGGTILHRKPIVADQSRPSTFIIYNLEIPEKHNAGDNDKLLLKRISKANTLANSTGAKAASNVWILNSIAACQLQSTEE